MARNPTMARVTTTGRHRPTVSPPLMVRHAAMAGVTTMGRHLITVRLPLIAHHRPATVRATTMARHRPTVSLPLIPRNPAMARQTTMARHLITVRRHARPTQFRMVLLHRYAPHAICSGDAPKASPVPGPVDGGGCAIGVAQRRSMQDLTAAMVRHPVHAISVPIEGMI